MRAAVTTADQEFKALRSAGLAGTIDAPPGLESPLRCESPSDALKALWLSERYATAALPRAAAAAHEVPGAPCLRSRKGGAHVRRSAPCQILSVDPWTSDDSPACERSAPLLFAEDPLLPPPAVSLSPPSIRKEPGGGRATGGSGGRRRASHKRAEPLRAAAAPPPLPPNVRWSCPALMVHLPSAAELRLHSAGGFAAG